MKFYAVGIHCGYEAEHTARIFYPSLKVVKQYPRAEDVVLVHQTARRILCAVRRRGVCCAVYEPCTSEHSKQQEYHVCKMLFVLLSRMEKQQPPWGMLTGIRPVRLLRSKRAVGMNDEQLRAYFQKDYAVSPQKYELLRSVERNQQPVLRLNSVRSYSLYISIPFCPSRCSYCSFVSRTTQQSAALMQPYLEKLMLELERLADMAACMGLRLKSVYLGGGTPTALSAVQLRELMQTVRRCFDFSYMQEYTVEAGRPDCTDEEKLKLIKQLGATRISINPQTMSDEVLRVIGRKHTARDIIECFEAARRVGHENINMDLIAGLPNDTPESFADSLAQIISLQPENITVHTLTLKRASNLVIEAQQHKYAQAAQMLAYCEQLLAHGYEPYYLYRQKGTLQNLENIGYTKPGFTGLYNVFIMEELHTILSAGAGGATKLVSPCGRIERIFNVKYPNEYIQEFSRMMDRKEGIIRFYEQFVDLDSQAAGRAGPAECGGNECTGADTVL